MKKLCSTNILGDVGNQERQWGWHYLFERERMLLLV